MVIKLRDVMGTRYIINASNYKVHGIFTEALKNGDTIDLAGCRLGPFCADLVAQFESQVEFINSEEPELDAMLRNNRRIIESKSETYSILDIPELHSKFNIGDYLTNLETGKYKVKLDCNSNKFNANIVITCLILLTRPDIELDLVDCTSYVFPRLCKHINVDQFIQAGCKEFIVEQAPLIYVVSTDDDNFNKNKTMFPAEILTKKIFNISTKKVYRKEYLECIKSLLGELVLYLNDTSKEFKVKLIDLLQFKEDPIDEF